MKEVLMNGRNHNLEQKAAIRKGKRIMSEIYESKMLTSEEVLSFKIEALYFKPGFSINFEQGGTSEYDELKEEEEYDYDQDKVILKSMYHYYCNNSGIIPSPYSNELINHIEDLIPNLKVCRQALTTKI
ncbi:hypothetical protein HAX54_041564 [Datura stramonium]|uniref:Uncharacterized protein n=1 Tax=Datura stramonium TaxID=4076 RepID=A0ABS8SLM1_DATST|nr:hypothetical protein [Datura stramonium]